MTKKIEKTEKIVTVIMLISIFTKILGFVKEMLLSYYFGASGISDAYLISQTIPGTIFQFVGTGLATSFIPIYYLIVRNKGKEEASFFTNKIVTIVLTFSMGVILCVYLNTPFVVKLFASGFTGETLKYACIFTRIGILSLLFSSVIYVYVSYLEANNKILSTSLAVIPYSIIVIVAIYFGAEWNIWMLSVGSALAVGVQMFFLIIAAKKTGQNLRIDFRWKNEYIKSFFSMLMPVILGVSVNEINVLIDRTLASQIAIGGISALVYAGSLVNMVQSCLVQPITKVFFPRITASVSSQNYEQARKYMKETMATMLGLLIPLAVGLYVYADPLVKILFGNGMSDPYAVSMIIKATQGYALGICFVGIRELISRYFYAYTDSKTPMKNATIGVIVNIVANIVLSKVWGISGLAIATSLSAIVTVLLLYFSLNKLPGKKDFMDGRQIIKILFATIITILISYAIYHALDCFLIIKLGVSVCLAVVVYIVLAQYMGIAAVREIIGLVKIDKKIPGE